MYKYPAHKQFQLTIRYLIHCLQETCSDYCGVAEITKQGNVHYHVWLVLEKELPMLLDSIKCSSDYGFIHVTKITKEADLDTQKRRVHEYLAKDVHKGYQYIRSISFVFNMQDVEIVMQDPDFDTSPLDLLWDN